MQDLLNRKSGLSDAKRALLEKRLRGEAHSAHRREVVTRCAGDGPTFPLSFAQERMWFVSQLDPDAAVYNIPVGMLIRAELDIPTLERAAAEVVRRHEALRTAYRAEGGDVVQVVEPPCPATVAVIDVRDRVGADFRGDVQRLVAEEGSRPFDLTRAPLLRVTLLRVSDERYAQVVTVHHIATDGWSMPLICREIDELYAAYAAGLPSPYPTDPELRYVDYAVWQRRTLAGEALERQVRYWRDHVAAAEPRELPYDRPRPPRQSYRGHALRFNVDPGVTHRLRDLCAHETVTLNMVLLAAFAAVLRRWAGGDLVIGSLFGNRSRAELEQVCGYFVNTLPLLVDLSDDPPFREAVRRARRVILEGDAHQDLPFEKLVDALGAERDPSRNPLFQVMYFHHVFARVHHGGMEGITRSLDPQPIYAENPISLVDTGISKFDMDLATLETGEGLMAVLNYASELFDAATAERLARHFVTLLDSAGRAPDARVSELESLPAAERAQVLGEWGAAPPPRNAPDEPLHRAFERQAALRPEAVAVVWDDGTLTFGALDGRASAVGRALRAAGAGPGARVAVLAEPSPGAVAALLGVLKAGAAYLPLDPALPPARLRELLDDARPAAVVADARGRAALPAGAPPVVRLEDAHGPAEPGADVDAASAAYVLYTSGSTGRPRGVVVSHGAARTHLAAAAEAYGLTPADRVLAFAALTFDPSLEQILAPLLAGASVALRGPELWSTAQFAQRVGEMGVTVVNPPTAYWTQLVMDPGALGAVKRSVRLAIAGGEAMLPEPARRWAAAAGGARLLNAYGPTEGVVTATAFEVPDGYQAERGRVPIGRPLPGRVARVLDAALRPAGVGVPGELCLGGPALAQGYLGLPAATAERFVPDPHGDSPGARLYRTGDRARWLPDGTLEFLGRADQQVKVRGFRVEPGEVEAALAAHPAVRRAAADARDDGGHRRLVAWVEAEGVDGAALRGWLAGRLPEHMVPSSVVVLPALPLTPTGKVDRRALPAPPAAASPAPPAPPRSHAEAVLARIWAEVLGRGEVGVHDSFFELGGDSILSIRVIARAAQEGVRITPRQVFELHTIAELAAVAGGAPAPVAEQGPVTGTAPLTPIQHWFFEQRFAHPAHWNMSALFELAERVDAGAVRAAWGAVLAHHDALRARFGPDAAGVPVQHVDAPGEAEVEVEELGGVPDDALAAAVEARASAAQGALEPGSGPVARAVLLECGPHRPQRLLVAVHHLVVDAVSWAVLAADLETALGQAAAGRPVLLPPKTTSFLEWSRRLAEHAAAPDTRREAEFWLRAVPTAPPVPLDGSAADDVEGATRGTWIELSPDETRALLQEVPAAYGTRVNEALLSAFARAYAAWSGGLPVVVELEGHGREALDEGVDLSRTVGWFTTQYPVALDAAFGAGPGEVLRAVKERLRAIPRNGIGYGLLRYLAGGGAAAELARRPAGGIGFNYLGQQAAPEPHAPAGEALLRTADEPAGAGRAPGNRRTQRLSVEAMTAGGQLRVGFFHGPSLHEASVERLAGEYLRALRELVAHCASGAGGFTPSDFPEAGLDQSALDALMSRLG
ncbi:MAG TPA: amino acid adenylation domain-containing protein [Longimicrobium sp.]|nr:amino acid adenylation domain-containing protein [Longimicrobium sp.]